MVIPNAKLQTTHFQTICNSEQNIHLDSCDLLRIGACVVRVIPNAYKTQSRKMSALYAPGTIFSNCSEILGQCCAINARRWCPCIKIVSVAGDFAAVLLMRSMKLSVITLASYIRKMTGGILKLIEHTARMRVIHTANIKSKLSCYSHKFSLQPTHTHTKDRTHSPIIHRK